MPIEGLSSKTQVINDETITGYVLNNAKPGEVCLDSTSFRDDIIHIFNVSARGSVKFFQEDNTFFLGKVKSEGGVSIHGNKDNMVNVNGDIHCNLSFCAQHIKQAKNTLIGTNGRVDIKNSTVATIASIHDIKLSDGTQHFQSKIQVLEGDLTVDQFELNSEITVSGNINYDRVIHKGRLTSYRDGIFKNSHLPDFINVEGDIIINASRQDPNGKIISDKGTVWITDHSKVGCVSAGQKVIIEKGSTVTSVHENLNRIYVEGKKKNIFRRLFYFMTGK